MLHMLMLRRALHMLASRHTYSAACTCPCAPTQYRMIDWFGWSPLRWARSPRVGSRVRRAGYESIGRHGQSTSVLPTRAVLRKRRARRFHSLFPSRATDDDDGIYCTTVGATLGARRRSVERTGAGATRVVSQRGDAAHAPIHIPASRAYDAHRPSNLHQERTSQNACPRCRQRGRRRPASHSRSRPMRLRRARPRVSRSARMHGGALPAARARERGHKSCPHRPTQKREFSCTDDQWCMLALYIEAL